MRVWTTWFFFLKNHWKIQNGRFFVRVSTFHLHVLGLAELLLAGFLLLLLRLMVVMVHVCDLTVVAAVVVLVPHALVRVGIRSERAPGSRRMRVRNGVARVGPGLGWRDLGLSWGRRRGMREGGRRGRGQRNADVFARYSPNLGAFWWEIERAATVGELINS